MRLRALPEGGVDLDLIDLGFDTVEAGLLAVARYFFLTHAAPARQAWHTGFAVAVERWGPDIGLPAAHAVAKLVRAVYDVRSDFGFHDPFGIEARTRVTSDEAMMMRMLHHMRRDETPDARDAVEVLTRGGMDPHVIRAGLTLSARFGGGVPEQRHAGRRPKLRVVS
ncbi:hypothetical protein [uncultured Tateyamaria sp.]|uniref:hypothetical protein n=1 Tax=uncultured Tateyamaria sp. TaxID=455651 RepID=UPI002629DE54|nr:hypothetical protein [uncultured Tateyamaria sp.]